MIGKRKVSGMSMHELAISWIASNKDVHCALIGSRSSEKIIQNIMAADIELPGELSEKLNLITQPVNDLLGNHMDLFESAAQDRSK